MTDPTRSTPADEPVDRDAVPVYRAAGADDVEETEEDRSSPRAAVDDAPAPAPATRAMPVSQGSTDVPAAPPQPVLPPAEPSPAPPRRRSNRLVGTMWALLAAGLFEVLYLLVIAVLVFPVGGIAAATQQLRGFAATPFAWLPVLFFFLFYELVVLLFNRAGRFFYLVASLIVALATYLVSVLLILLLARGSLGDPATLTQTFESLYFVLIGVIAREVMLWTGFAIGARGKRLRRRNRVDRERYERELAERADATA